LPCQGRAWNPLDLFAFALPAIFRWPGIVAAFLDPRMDLYTSST